MNLSGLSNSQIEQAIEKMQKGIEIKPNSPEAVELQTSIDRALEELQRRAQKKSVEPSANQGQLNQPNRTRPELNQSLGIPSLNETPEKLAADQKKEFETTMQKSGLMGSDKPSEVFKKSLERYEQRVIGIVTAAPVITVPVVEISLSSGTKQMNRTEIMTMLKTWFKRVATSKAMEEGRFSDAYGGAMGQDTWKLFNGWRMIYNETREGTEYPPMLDCFPGYKNAKANHKVNAEILWRWASNEK